MVRIRGRITVTPRAVTGIEVALDRRRPCLAAVRAGRRHRGRPREFRLALARARLFRRQLRDPGAGGGFPHLDLGAPLGDDAAATFYDAELRDGSRLGVALQFGVDGRGVAVGGAAAGASSPTFWRLGRGARADPGVRPAQVKAMLDVPFSRSLVRTRMSPGATRWGCTRRSILTASRIRSTRCCCRSGCRGGGPGRRVRRKGA